MLLMEAGVSYNKQKLHKAGYFRELLATNPAINEGLGSLLRLCRETVVRLQRTESALVRSLERDPLLMDRVERLMTIPAVEPITALTWALEVGEVQRFSSIKKAISYCGLLLAKPARMGQPARTEESAINRDPTGESGKEKRESRAKSPWFGPLATRKARAA
jgi:transposase